MKKRILSTLLVLAMCMSLYIPAALAENQIPEKSETSQGTPWEARSPIELQAVARYTAQEGVVITVAYPGNGKDASPNIQEAIARAKELGRPTTLAFEKDKTYEVWPETAYNEQGYYISNAATKAENPNGQRWSAIFLKDMKDVTIEGNNAMLMVHGVMTPILVDHSENIIFQNLHVDWARPTMSEFTIKEVGSNYAKIQVNKSSLYRTEGTRVHWYSEEKPGGGYYWDLTGGLCVVYDPVTDTARGSSFSWGSAITDEGDNVLKLTYSTRPGLTVGQTYQFRSGSRDQVGSFIHRSKDVHFENMGFHYMHGLGIVGQYTENISFNNLDCTPRPETGRTCASSADFVQISGCKGLVSITNSKFKGAHDDVFNIHGTHLQIVNKDEALKKITVRFMQERSWGFQAFDVGDKIEFVTPNNMLAYANNIVERFNRLNDYNIELFLKDPLPAGIALNSDVVENITNTPDVLVRNNYASAVTTRGILCTTRGQVLIEGNTFYKMGMSGVLLEDDTRQWFESGPIKNMTIKDNIFDNCGGPCIYSNPQTSMRDPNQTVHSNITITGNTFRGNGQISAHSTSNLIVEGNTFENDGSVSLDACNGFQIRDNNTGLNSVSVNRSLNDRSLASLKLEATSDVKLLDRTGMTATANERSGYPAGNILDGNNNTFWHSDWDNIPNELSVIVDLNGEKSFNRVAVLPRQSDDQGKITSYMLYTKNGEGEFTLAASGDWAANMDEKYITFSTAVTATQIKLVATGVTLDSQQRRIASIAEINFQNAQELTESVPVGKKFRVEFVATGNTGVPAQLPENAVIYASSNLAVATVAADGTITALTAGTSDITITVTAYGKILSKVATIAVTAETYTGATSISIDPIGAGAQLTATVVPQAAVDDLRWSVTSLSGAAASIGQDGLLAAPDNARLLVTAYSQNDPTIKDTLMLIAVKNGETAETWSIVRETKANWKLGEGNSLELTTESGAIWAHTNNVKNVIATAAGTDDFSLVAKMDYKPGADYAEAGIILYADDDNYAMVTRKRHSGYGGNIFSMITEAGSETSWESPATKKVMDTVAASEIYLKLTKSGNSYSSYYSTDGTTWNPVYENRIINPKTPLRAGVIGYGSGVAKYAYLEIDGKTITFEDMVPIIKFSQAKLMAVTPAQCKTVKGAAWGKLPLPERVALTWDNGYQDAEPVTWNYTGYDGDAVGICTVNGTLQTVSTDMLGGLAVTAQITVIADKSALKDALRIAQAKTENRYTVESWTKFVSVRDAAVALLANTDNTVTQETVDTQTAALDDAIEALSESMAVTGVTLDKSAMALTVGGSGTLTATIVPANAANQNVSWESSDPNVATAVDGLVTAMKVGTATITVTTEDGNKTDTCAVTVNAATYPVTVTDGKLADGKTGGSYAAGVSITATADAAPQNQRFKNWTASGISLGDATVNPVTFTMPAGPVALSAHYVDVPLGTLTGITLTPGDGKVTLAAIEPEGSEAYYYKHTDTSDAINRNVYGDVVGQGWTPLTADADISGENMIPIYVQVVKAENGAITAWGEATAVPVPEDVDTYTLKVIGGSGSGTYPAGMEVEVAATVLAGKKFVSWTAEGIDLTEAERKEDPLTITMPEGNVTLTANFGTSTVAVTGVKLVRDTMRVYRGNQAQLAGKVEPADATNQDVIWTSSDERVATVDQTGLVTAVADGTVTITVTTVESDFTAKCTVTVEAYVAPIDTPSTTKTETKKNEDGSTTRTVTDLKTGTVTETTAWPDGTKLVTVTDKDGVSRSEVTVPKDKGSVTVTIPMGRRLKPGEVAVIIRPDGTKEIVKTSAAAEDGIRVTLTERGVLEIIDNSKRFIDVETKDWFDASVQFVASRELFNGTGANTFSPDAPTSRAMLMTVLARLNGADTSQGETWYSAGMEWAVVNGVSDGTNPEGSITREQLALMLYRYVGADKTGGDLGKFSDAGEVSAWAAEAMTWAVETGIIQGSAGRLSPTAAATRAEVAVMLERFITHQILHKG